MRHREWSETSQTVILLTRNHGLINGLAKGSRRERAYFSGGFELLQHGELGFVSKADKDLITLTDWDLTNPFIPLRSRYAASVIAMFAAELTVSLLAQGDPHPSVFDAFLALLGECGESDQAGTTADCRPLAAYLSALLIDTGQFPDLTPPPTSDTAVLLFDPAHARLGPSSSDATRARDPFSPGPDQEGHWPVRRETIELITNRVDADEPNNDGGTGPSGNPRLWVRAARFLAAWVVYRSARRPASLDSFIRITRF